MSAPSPEQEGARTPSLRDSLALIAPSLPAALAGPEAVRWLDAVAGVLPPVHRAGFECRLSADDGAVDLQQGIFAADGEPARLARMLAGAACANEPWQAVQRLAERWATPGDVIQRGVDEVWLELDATPEAPWPSALSDSRPSVFAVMERSGGQALQLADELVRLLLPDADHHGLHATIARLAGACPAPARLSHIGVMVGRPLPALRVHVSPVPVREMGTYLAHVGWDSDTAELSRLAALLLSYGDWAVLCLDVYGDQVLRLGLECFFARKSGLDPNWQPLLERLTEEQLCTAEKARALVAWPGSLTPLQSPGPWPQDLIAWSLTEPETRLGLFERRLSHVKLSFAPDRAVTAKAYFGYGHGWAPVSGNQPAPATGNQPAPATGNQPAPATGNQPAPATDRPRDASDRRPGAAAAVEAAVAWLLAARHQSGWWRDFPIPAAGFSDEWPTAYVGAALARTSLPGAREAAASAMDLLRARRPNLDGWGYSVRLPPDGDSTAWALRLAHALGDQEPADFQPARGFLDQLTAPNGGVACYLDRAVPAVDRIMRVGGSYEGWCTPHVCITAAAAGAGHGAATEAYLRGRQNADGSWSSYWWPDDEYATAWAVDALMRSGSSHHGADPALEASVSWFAARVGEDGAVRRVDGGEPEAFLTAMALYTLRLAEAIGERLAGGTDKRALHAAERAQQWLLDQQRADGSWAPSARIRVPMPSVQDPAAAPEGVLREVADTGPWTTATVLLALLGDAQPRAWRA